jgi:hypothetical protein
MASADICRFDDFRGIVSAHRRRTEANAAD